MERISHYDIVRRIGQGGMGEVYEAIDLDLDRRVALKFLASGYASDPDGLRRFEREARAAAALHHPRIATVFGFDRTTERPFIAMELLAGRTLRDEMTSGTLTVERALSVSRDVAEALAFAHRRGVVHRDIKPENLMFDGDGAIKITDFGLARIANSHRLTTTGSHFGTAAYMAPESIAGGGGGASANATDGTGTETSPPQGAAGDVFALGVTLHEMLAGGTPFQGASPLAMLYAIANEPPGSLRAARPEVPEPVEGLVARMLEKDPAARISAAEAARELSLLTGVAPARTEHVVAPSRGRARRWIQVAAALAVIAALIPGVLRMRAKARFREAVVLNNEGHDSLTAGNLDGARQRFEAALDRAPHYAEAKLNLAVVAHRAGDENRAAGLYGQVIAENPSRKDWLAAAHYGLGEIDLQAQAWPSAVLHLAEAARLDSTRVEYPNNLGFALAQSGRTDQALATLRAAQTRFPGEAALIKNVALSWLKAGQFDSALVAANEAIRLQPMYAEAWLVKERSEAALGDPAAARASLATLRTLDPAPEMITEAEAALREEPTRPAD